MITEEEYNTAMEEIKQSIEEYAEYEAKKHKLYHVFLDTLAFIDNQSKKHPNLQVDLKGIEALFYTAAYGDGMLEFLKQEMGKKDAEE